MPQIHSGGGIFNEVIEGINVHKYGPHIFHTSDEKVWNFVRSLTPFNNFINSPVANYKGEIYNLPFNMNTFYQMWKVRTPQEAMQKLEKQRQNARVQMQQEGITEPQNLEQQARLLIGDDIYRKLIKGYTEKQWGKKCNELPAFIIRRLPVRFTFNNNYFDDTYQGIPVGGYNKLTDALLQRADVITGINFFSDRKSLEESADRIIFTGKIDEFFEYRFGKLEYRSLKFETEILNTANYQGNAVVNYTDSQTPYTRVIEHKHFEFFGGEVYKNPKTVITREYSIPWQDGTEPFYPVNDKRNMDLYSRYSRLAEAEDNVIFAGRLAEYRYYNMDQIVSKVLNEFEK